MTKKKGGGTRRKSGSPTRRARAKANTPDRKHEILQFLKDEFEDENVANEYMEAHKEELREILKKYKWAVLFIQDIPSEVIVRDKATIKERVKAYQDIFKIVNKIESMAFYDGNYLAFGFAAGSCRHTYCWQDKTCRALEGERCKFSLRARPSMEAVGIDVYRMVTSQGWDIYPIGSDAKAEDIPKGTLAGIIIVN